jgi:ketosteroid isomerase-like protein
VKGKLVKLRYAIATLGALSLVDAGAAAGQSPRKPAARPETAPGVAAEIRALLDSSAAAWNRGDVRGHLATNADSIWFMTRHGPVVGNDSVVEMMTRSYFQNGRPLQTLRSDHLTVRPLGKGFALAVGQFILSGGDRDEQSGWFSTVWERRPEGWRVIHDHSS